MSITVLDPTAESTLPRHTPAQRLSSLKGKHVWFLDNQGQHWGQGTPQMNPLFQRWQKRLQEEHGITSEYACTEQFTAPFRHGKAKLEEVAKSADAVINGLACCGSGTSAVVHDAIEYELRGVPTVTLVTDSVIGHAKLATRKLGMDVQIVVCSHNVHMFAPVATPTECAAAADELYDAMVACLVGASS
ncbi:MAG: hypothetical protein ABI321_19215 [Polyangia bacterium]